MKKHQIKQIVKQAYRKIAKSQSGCCSCSCNANEQKKIAKAVGYSDEELKTPGNLGLGCGNPTALAQIKEGDIVLDLGSGAGFDCFLASKKVGKTGKVIGVDMVPEMIEKSKKNAKEFGFQNIEFKLGEIENLPIESSSIDVIISNCVINLSPDKERVFKEAYRVLKKGGKMFVSDIVLLGELNEEQKNSPDLLSGCVAGALQKKEYLKIVKNTGLRVKILSEDKKISKTQYQGVNLESLKIEAMKL